MVSPENPFCCRNDQRLSGSSGDGDAEDDHGNDGNDGDEGDDGGHDDGLRSGSAAANIGVIPEMRRKTRLRMTFTTA
jgi:hypothetical protein